MKLLPFFNEVFPPDNAPSGKAPVGVKPFNCSTLSLSSLEDKKNDIVGRALNL